MTAALIVGLSAVALYLWKRLASAKAEVSELQQQNARLRRRLERGAG
jgi:hypothetical protein